VVPHFLFPRAMQALSLMKAHVHRQAVETAQVVRVVELEMQNSKLLAVLEQTRAAFADVDATQNSLSLAREKLEEECAGLCIIVESLGQEKAAHEIERKRF
jgi:hypothetical protein